MFSIFRSLEKVEKREIDINEIIKVLNLTRTIHKTQMNIQLIRQS